MNYEISVFNSGNIPDNYLLESDDNQAWSLSLENYTLENVAPSENLMTTLSVTIPENADPGTKNNIVVTATSQENFQIIDSTSCIAEVIKQQPADEEEPQEQGRETLTVFVTLLVVLLAILAFAVWWRKRE